MGNSGQTQRIVAGAAGLCFLAASALLVVGAPGERPMLLNVRGAGNHASASDNGHASRSDDDSAPGGGWEDNRPPTTGPDNSRPETPPGHDKPGTTSTTTKRGRPTTTTTGRPTTTTPAAECWAAQPEELADPADYVPQCTVLDVYPSYGAIGPISPTDGNLRQYDHPIAAHGATRGYARTWLSTPDPGGYTVYAWEFPTADAARAAKADSHASFVDDFGGTPFSVRDDVAAAMILGDTVRAAWVQGRYLRVVALAMLNRDAAPNQAAEDMRTIVHELIDIEPRGCCS